MPKHSRQALKIDGHGHCGEITFEAEVDPTALTICHCTDCQTITAAKAAAFIIGVLILGGVADVAYTERFRMAADQGDAAVEHNIGLLYENGWGVTQDYAEAMSWYRKAADQGDAFAQNKVGWFYYNGWSVKQDYREAMRWYRIAADQGDALAQNNIGWMYAKGQGVPRDLREARAWIERAAASGYEDAKRWLAAH